MSEEEKKAIEDFKKDYENDLSRYDDFNSYTQFIIRRNGTILNLIGNQQKEIEDFENIKNEHRIMKRIIQENGLWETLLNDNEFLKHLNEEN